MENQDLTTETPPKWVTESIPLDEADNAYLDHDSRYEQIEIELDRVRTQEQTEAKSEPKPQAVIVHQEYPSGRMEVYLTIDEAKSLRFGGDIVDDTSVYREPYTRERALQYGIDEKKINRVENMIKNGEIELYKEVIIEPTAEENQQQESFLVWEQWYTEKAERLAKQQAFCNEHFDSLPIDQREAILDSIKGDLERKGEGAAWQVKAFENSRRNFNGSLASLGEDTWVFDMVYETLQQKAKDVVEEETAETSKQPLLNTQSQSISTSLPTEEKSAPQSEQDPFKTEFNRGQAPEKTGGEIYLDYTFERFNANSEYTEVKKSKLNPLNILDRNEAVFEHKNDGSRITIKKDKIICDNTERNIHAALDIAQDKGWDVIKITGGSKAAKAEMWFEANMRGLETRGYEPSEADKKRLLGAQERARKEQEMAKGQSLADALDIKPKVDDKNQGVAPQSEEKSSAEALATKNNTADKEQTVSQQQYWLQVRKEIMAEVDKFLPLNEKDYKQLENTIDNQLSIASKANKTLDVNKFKENIRNGLPTIRQELDAAAQMEQRQARAAEQQQQRRKPETKER